MKHLIAVLVMGALLLCAGAMNGQSAIRGIPGAKKVTPTVITSITAIKKHAEEVMRNAPTDGMFAREEMSNMTEEQEEELRAQPLPEIGGSATLTIDKSAPVMGPTSATSVNAPILSTNFEGNLQGGSRPGDLMIAVGPKNVVSVANSTVRIRSKTGTVQLTASALGFMGVNYGGFDPKVAYDIVAGRFIMLWDDVDNTQSVGNATYWVGVSQTDDAMGGWNVYQFDMRYDGATLTSNWADFPGLGFDDNAIYMTGNMYSYNSTTSNNEFHYLKTRVVDKNAMYLGLPVNYVDIIGVPGGTTQFTLKPAQSLSPTTTEYLLINPNGGGNKVQVYKIEGSPSAPVLTWMGSPGVSSYGIPPKGVQKDCASTPVDAGDARTQEPVFRDGFIYLANQVGVSINGKSACAVRYYKIKPGLLPTVVTEETFGAEDNYYLYPAVTVDGAGSVFLTFSRMSSTEYASAAYTGRRLTDTAFQPSTILKAGGSAYWCLLSAQRWGDYEGVSLDPSETSDTLGAAWVNGNWAKGPSTWGSWLGKTLFYYHRVSGTVYSDCDSNGATAGDRKPLAGVRVAITLDSTYTDTVTSDPDGKYSFGFLNDGTYTVSVIVPGTDFALDAFPGTGGAAQSKLNATELSVTLAGAATASSFSVNNDFALVVPHPVPTATLLSPNTYSSGEPGFTLTVTGGDFEPCAYGTVDGSPRATTFVNDTTIQVSILATDILSIGSFTVAVVNPTPAGGTSNGLTFTIHAPAPIFSAAPGSLAFGTLLVGQSKTDTFHVTNTGTADLNVSAVTTTDAVFSVAPASGTIPRQTTLDFLVTYSPALQTSNSGGVVFAHNAASSPDTLGVSGSGLDSTSFRTASMRDWANAFDAKHKRKSYPRKADKVFFEFTLKVPGDLGDNPRIVLYYSMAVSSVQLYAPPTFTSVLPYQTVTPDAKYKTFTYAFSPDTTTWPDSGSFIKGVGVGAAGKKITIKYAFFNSSSGTKATFKGTMPDANGTITLNQPALPAPNLVNVGEELFPKGFNQGTPYYSDVNPLIVGIPTGTKNARSVKLKKFSDVLKSLVDDRSGTMHTQKPSCLVQMDNGSPITAQLGVLSPLKKNDVLFGELLALKLNMGASAAGKFPVGFGQLSFVNPDTLTAFDGVMLKDIATRIDSELSCTGTLVDTGGTMRFLRMVNAAFRDTANNKDTISFLPKTILKGVQPLGLVPFLRKTPGITPETFVSPNIVNNDVPRSFRLYQNYPNPFNPTTSIRFDLPVQGFVSLRIYNVLGQVVATLIEDQLLDDGVQEFEFDANRYASGVYFYRLTVHAALDGEEDVQMRGATIFTDVKKMLLMK